MNGRRRFLIAAGTTAFATPLITRGQQPGRIWRIGFLGAFSASASAAQLEAFRAGLRELSYIEGGNLIIEFRWAEGKLDRLQELATELVGLKVDVIVTHQHSGASAAKRATTTIPIVVAVVGDAVASGLVASLARPGGNVTGSSFFSQELNAKRLELLKEVFPRIHRVAVLSTSDGTGSSLPAMEAAAGPLKLELRQFGVRSPDEFESVFAAMTRQHVEAVAIVESAITIANARVAASLVARYRIPSVGFVEIAEGGGLMAYGVNFPALYRRAAVFVDKILRGAGPGDLPIERATTFDLVINRKAAQALGVAIPQTVLVRANRVIE